MEIRKIETWVFQLKVVMLPESTVPPIKAVMVALT
jgi:hypothetical protein